MSINCVEKKLSKLELFLNERTEQVNLIRKKHSQKLFGNTSASVKEIRTEALKQRLESNYNI